MIDTDHGNVALSALVPDWIAPTSSLAHLSGDASLADAGNAVEGLEYRIAIAWSTPLLQLSCAQARLLVGQRFGIEWLARPVALFVTAQSHAECDLYPGDLSIVALVSWRAFYSYAPSETISMLRTDFRWLSSDLQSDPSDELVRDAHRHLVEGRAELNLSQQI